MQQYLTKRSSTTQEGSKQNQSKSQWTKSSFDITAFQQNNQQLMSYLQELDINPYSLDPLQQQQLFTDIKLLFPNLYQQLYPQTNTPSGAAQPTQNKQISYECKRKFCTFCLRTNYEESLEEIMKNKNWHCHHCTGYCICTRCLRQDIITQLKAYLISLGGNLNTLVDSSDSVFDALILKNFNQHLELTLGQNQWLYQTYPSYIKMINGQNDNKNYGQYPSVAAVSSGSLYDDNQKMHSSTGLIKNNQAGNFAGKL